MVTVDLFTNKIFEATNSKFEDGTFVKEEAYNKRDHLLLEHKHFYDSVLNTRPAIVGLKDGLNAVHLIDCTIKAMETQTVVAVKLG